MKPVSGSQCLFLVWIAKRFSLPSVNIAISTIHILLSLLFPLSCVNFSSNWL